ncbi:MAG: threonylcarbamoyl-AMP synthase [Tannerellaceae bacterium]|jgi:L-threonylcarbamoyladenylate synthase|nr:threonylcarbamoyl-AMP synthase [Tannerellaceae bacterium]
MKMTEEINTACNIMHEGGLILFPSDTIWGLGCDATSEAAVERIFAIKRRNDRSPLLAIVGSLEQLCEYVGMPSDEVLRFMESFSTPLTIVYPRARHLARNLLASNGSIGIRLTKDPFVKQLCLTFGKPIVGTSANVSGQPAPQLFNEISQEILSGVDYAFEYRRLSPPMLYPMLPSSVVRISADGRYIEFVR